MTNEMMQLQGLLEKSADADVLREMIGFASQRLMELEVSVRAGYGEKNPARLVQRNGYRERDWQTRAGTVELQIPKLRQGGYFPSFLAPRRQTENALTAVVPEAYLQGGPDRSTIWCRPWAAPASPRARCRGRAQRSTDRWAPSSIAPLRVTGPTLDRCDVCEGPSGWAHRQCGGDHCHRRQRRWPT